MDSEEGRQTVHRRPVGLTITVEKIDRVLADVQTQIETLRQNRINLGLVREQLAGMKAKWGVNERRHKASIQEHCERTA